MMLKYLLQYFSAVSMKQRLILNVKNVPKKWRWCVAVLVQQCLQMVSCLSVTFSPSSSDGETKLLPHVRTRWSIGSLTNFVSWFFFTISNTFVLIQAPYKRADCKRMMGSDGNWRSYLTSPEKQCTFCPDGLCFETIKCPQWHRDTFDTMMQLNWWYSYIPNNYEIRHNKIWHGEPETVKAGVYRIEAQTAGSTSQGNPKRPVQFNVCVRAPVVHTCSRST